MVVFAVVTGASAALVVVVVLGLAFGLWWGSKEEDEPLINNTTQHTVATGIGFSMKKGWVERTPLNSAPTSWVASSEGMARRDSP